MRLKFPLAMLFRQATLPSRQYAWFAASCNRRAAAAFVSSETAAQIPVRIALQKDFAGNNAAINKSKSVLIKGWLQDVRLRKTHAFLEVNDGSTYRTIQVVLPRDMYNNLLPQPPTYGTAVAITGQWQKSPGPQQPTEIIADSVQTVGECDLTDFPFKVRNVHSMEYVRQYPHLRARTRFFSSLLRVRHALNLAIHNYFNEHGFTFIQTPILTTNDCEGGSEAFAVVAPKSAGAEYFGQDRQAYLSVSGQLHLEAMACGLSKVYNFSPAFRAELSLSSRHLSEFYMIEAELAFLQPSLDELLSFTENFLISLTRQIVKNNADDCEDIWQHSLTLSTMEENNSDSVVEDDKARLKRLRRKDVAKDKLDAEIMPESVRNLISSHSQFQRITYDEAFQIIHAVAEKFNTSITWGDNFHRDHEQYLCQHAASGRPLFITHFPQCAKPFYMRRSDSSSTLHPNEPLTDSFDLIFPLVGELVGGSLRENRLDLLQEQLQRHGLQEKLKWYADLRRYGSTQMGGFGLGVERYLQWLLNVPNIKDVVPFARWYKHCPL